MKALLIKREVSFPWWKALIGCEEVLVFIPINNGICILSKNSVLSVFEEIPKKYHIIKNIEVSDTIVGDVQRYLKKPTKSIPTHLVVTFNKLLTKTTT